MHLHNIVVNSPLVPCSRYFGGFALRNVGGRGIAARCVGKLGVKGLVRQLPGGDYLYDFGAMFLAEVKAEGRSAGEVVEFVGELVTVSFDQALAEARAVVPEALAAAGVEATPAETAAIELWLAGAGPIA